MADNSDTKGASGLGDVRNLLGFLVAGFAGAVNLLGLKSAEVGVILRNESFRVSIIAIFLLAGILAAVASVFVKSGEAHPISPLVALAAFLLLVSAFSLSIWVIFSAVVTTPGEHAASMWVTMGLWAATALVLLVWVATKVRGKVIRIKVPGGVIRARVPGRRLPKGPPHLPELFNLQSLLLVVAVMLTSTATYGVLRLETISQTTTVAALGDSLQMNGHEATLAISVSAAKLTTQEWLGINVMGAPRRWHLASMCDSDKVADWKSTHAVAVTCAQDPCYYVDHALHRRCAELSEDVIPPDSAGGVHQTIDLLISAMAFQHVQVTAVTCEPSLVSNPKPVVPTTTIKPGQLTIKTQPKGTCVPTGGSSRLDLAIPRSP